MSAGAATPEDVGATPTPQSASPVNWVTLTLGFGGMVIGQFMAILDIQIVAASLGQIQAGVGASADQISWVQTSYLIAEVVMIPLSGFLSRLWGTQPVFLVSCAGFLLMSVLTGLSSNFEMMVATRALQGFLGGAMIPIVFATAFTAFPPERRVMAGVIMGLIVTLAPTVGPTIGGHLSEALGWRWLFFVNVFPGIVSLLLVWRFGDFDKGDKRLAQNFDWIGLALMAVGLVSLQFTLEEGARNDWFADPMIASLCAVGVIALVLFAMRSLKSSNPIVDLRAFSDRNFSVGVFMTFTTGAALFGGTFLLPLFLARVREFSSAEIGTTMLISGLAMFLSGPIAGRIISRLDLRIPISVGFGMCAFGMWQGVHVTSQWGFWEFATMQAIRGSGVMLAMIAAQQLTIRTLAPATMKNASGIVNLMRNVGGAFGLAVLNTLLIHQTAEHSQAMHNATSVADPRAGAMLQGLTDMMATQGLADPEGAAMKAMSGMMEREATTAAFADAFLLIAGACALASAVAWLAAPGGVNRSPDPSAAGAH